MLWLPEQTASPLGPPSLTLRRPESRAWQGRWHTRLPAHNALHFPPQCICHAGPCPGCLSPKRRWASLCASFTKAQAAPHPSLQAAGLSLTPPCPPAVLPPCALLCSPLTEATSGEGCLSFVFVFPEPSPALGIGPGTRCALSIG